MVNSGEKWGDFMLMGEYHHNIDDKNRLTIPSKFRYELGEKFIVTRGLDGCLFVYPMDEWNKIIEKLQTLPFTKKDARAFLRFFLSGATECEFDRQGRINISTPLADYAGLKKECIVIGVNDRIEIWSKESWEQVLTLNQDNLSDIAENLFESNIGV